MDKKGKASKGTMVRQAERELEPEYVDLIPRDIEEIREAENEMFERVWYDRHQMIRSGPEYRDVPFGGHPGDEPACRLEEKYGEDDLGPYDDFEWGMLSGKLSALRWVLGDEWDNLSS